MNNERIYDLLIAALNDHKETFLLTIIAHPEQRMIGCKILLWENGDFYTESSFSLDFLHRLTENCEKPMKRKRSTTISFIFNESLVECFVEYFPAPIHLIIAGAGHVCEPVAEMGKMLGFFVTVIDDRIEFANRDRFPNVDEVICQSYLQYFKEVELSNKSYILLLTRGHKYDVLSLQELLKREEKAAYIGMIGSRRRISGVFEKLRQNFPEDHFDSLYTPVGLDLGAETPSEIAISIMAEILKVKNKKSGGSLSSKIRQYAKMGFHE
ncbi:XdhC family protein [Bacillus sp. FJAT-29790]|uniref:XdhC family protein n=1 Tax=Bacillus sp. FJAT-29790 TaxID=1895002 RepID=UPI001C24760B|nr:XdhC family protein [Bacillus sp. FJAT-29790]MBU8878572.1 XdhC family protein [Bacillus sp. FJAT-29790]